MNKEMAKRAFEDAQKELKNKQIEDLKKVVKKTLEKLESLKKDKVKIDKQIKILRMDLDDLKEGKLDRIAERQEKDKDSEKTSVVKIIKEKEIIREHYVDSWYVPYRIIWNTPHWINGSDTITLSSSGNYLATATDNNYTFTVTNSIAKNYSAGTYDIDGNIIHFR